MQKSKLHLKFDIGLCRGQAMGMTTMVNGVTVDQVTEFRHSSHELTLDITMPAEIVFQVYGKDLNTDTVVSADGVIVEDKFVRLSQVVLGGVEIPEHVLIQNLDCDFVRGPQKMVYWGEPGTVTLLFAADNIVSWHLKTLINNA